MQLRMHCAEPAIVGSNLEHAALGERRWSAFFRLEVDHIRCRSAYVSKPRLFALQTDSLVGVNLRQKYDCTCLPTARTLPSADL
jgi:hypothetical protein